MALLQPSSPSMHPRMRVILTHPRQVTAFILLLLFTRTREQWVYTAQTPRDTYRFDVVLTYRQMRPICQLTFARNAGMQLDRKKKRMQTLKQ